MGGVKGTEALEKGTQNETEQEVSLDRTCFLSRLTVLSCGTWAKISQICIYKLFSNKTSSVGSAEDYSVLNLHLMKMHCFHSLQRILLYIISNLTNPLLG